VGLDVKAMRTTTAEHQTKHLANSREIFLRLVDVCRSVDTALVEQLRQQRDYEELERYIIGKLMGR
jgi:xylose isomerase